MTGEFKEAAHYTCRHGRDARHASNRAGAIRGPQRACPHSGLSEDTARRAGRLSHARRQGGRALRRQGQKPEETGGAYAKSGGHTERIARMIADTAEMLFLTTASETEALLLESNLIKRLKPRYNVSFRDDKSFPNILLRQDHPFRADIEASRRQDRERRLFRPFRLGRRRQPHAQRVATRVSVAVVLGLDVRDRAPAPVCCSRSSAVQHLASGASTRAAIARSSTKRKRFSAARAVACRPNSSPR